MGYLGVDAKTLARIKAERGLKESAYGTFVRSQVVSIAEDIARDTIGAVKPSDDYADFPRVAV